MLRIQLGGKSRYCDGVSRRSFLQIGAAGMASASLAQIMQAKAMAGSETKKDTRVILIWLDGGPGHMDMYDMKPDAPAEYRGIWSPIKTNVAGMEITELYPLQAKCADKFSIIRSLYHNTGDHFTGAHYILTGRGGASGADNTGKQPFIGSIATRVTGPRVAGMPPQVAVPYAMSIGLRPGYFGANYLGVQNNPFETEGDPNSPNFKVQNLDLPSQVTVERLGDRQTLSKQLDHIAQQLDVSSTSRAISKFESQAYELVVGPQARKAFDLSQEKDAVRDRYGRDSWGQSVLLARRLTEAGTTWVTCHFGGWDHHWDLQKGYENYLPKVDQCVSALLEDLAQRGTLANTLVLLTGEFSRTPRMNDGGNGGAPMSMGTPGRDHWGNAMFCLIAGGGVKGGQIIGSTNRLGESPKDRPVTCADLHHTIFHSLGVDPNHSFLNNQGRPMTALEPGNVISELF
jgi:hypothetical protein